MKFAFTLATGIDSAGVNASARLKLLPGETRYISNARAWSIINS